MHDSSLSSATIQAGSPWISGLPPPNLFPRLQNETGVFSSPAPPRVGLRPAAWVLPASFLEMQNLGSPQPIESEPAVSRGPQVLPIKLEEQGGETVAWTSDENHL